MSYHYEIIVCSTCKGTGVQQHEELTDYHKREYDYWTTTCSFCEGSGLLKKTTEIKYSPHKPDIPRDRN